MITRIPYETLHVSTHHWLESRFHFSFADYYNPKNTHFGVLRVMNDDVIAPRSGFEMHPHRDMEIFTYVLQGELTHKDSMGNEETLYAGDIQYMSAGSGVFHSEKNESDAPLHLIQTWILPSEKGVKPQYGSYTHHAQNRLNHWEHLFGPKESDAVIPFYQDANVYATIQEEGHTSHMRLDAKRKVYVKVMKGDVNLNGTPLYQGDAAEVSEEDLVFQSHKEAHILLIEMAQ